MKGNAPMKPIVCTLLLVFMAGRAPAWAEGNGALSVEGPELQRALKQLEDGDFDRAVETLERGLSRPDLTDAQLVEMYRLLGLASLYLGREEKAREAYEKLLQAMPDYELPRATSPATETRAAHSGVVAASLSHATFVHARFERLHPCVARMGAFRRAPGVQGHGGLQSRGCGTLDGGREVRSPKQSPLPRNLPQPVHGGWFRR